MENEENKVIDDSVFRWQHTIDRSLVSTEGFNAWINTPVTESLLKMLERFTASLASQSGMYFTGYQVVNLLLSLALRLPLFAIGFRLGNLIPQVA